MRLFVVECLTRLQSSYDVNLYSQNPEIKYKYQKSSRVRYVRHRKHFRHIVSFD